MVELHMKGNQFAVSTNCSRTEDFLRECSKVLADLNPGSQELDGWLPLIVETACRLKGYKADVYEERRIVAGTITPDAVVGWYDDHGGRPDSWPGNGHTRPPSEKIPEGDPPLPEERDGT